MPTKTTKSGREYDIDRGRWLIWHAEVWEDEGETPFDIRLPLRMKTKVLWSIDGSADSLDAAAMRAILEAIAPDAREQMAEMDLLDFQAMFETWQHEYETLSGASLGESSSSSS